jgi:hypothetical protein
MRFLTKKLYFAVSIILLLIPAAVYVIQSTCDYDAQGWCWRYATPTVYIGTIFFAPAILFFIFNSVVLFLPYRVFQNWRIFSVSAIILIILVTHALFQYREAHPVYIDLATPLYLLIMYALFFFVSVWIIGISAYRSRKKY